MSKVSSDETLKLYIDAKTKLLEFSGDSLRVKIDEKTGSITRIDLPPEAYREFMQSHGLTKELLKQHHDAHGQLAGALQLIAADYTEKAVVAVKANGGDGKEATAPLIVLPTMDGQFEAEVKPYATGRNPKTGEATESFGRPSLSVRLSSPMRRAVGDYTRTTFTKLLSGAN